MGCLTEKVLGLGQRRGGGWPPPPYSPPNCRTPLGVTHWLAAAPVFRPKKGGGHFFDIFDPPPLPQNLKKVGFKWGGGPDQKLIGGCVYSTK